MELAAEILEPEPEVIVVDSSLQDSTSWQTFAPDPKRIQPSRTAKNNSRFGGRHDAQGSSADDTLKDSKQAECAKADPTSLGTVRFLQFPKKFVGDVVLETGEKIEIKELSLAIPKAENDQNLKKYFEEEAPTKEPPPEFNDGNIFEKVFGIRPGDGAGGSSISAPSQPGGGVMP